MEEEDSYSYFSKIFLLCSLQSRFALPHYTCLQKRSFQEYSHQDTLLEGLNPQVTYQQDPSIQRLKPLVPKFEDPYKKVKTEDNCIETEIKTEETSCTSTTSQTTVIPNTNLDRESPAIITKEEDLTYIDDIKPEEVIREHMNPDIPPLEIPVTTSKTWSKKDVKKLRKFQELYRNYQEQLDIQSPLVSEKFYQIARLAIPQLLTHFKSKPFEAVSAAVLLYACREVNYPITLRQITSITNSKEKLINKCVFSLKEILPWSTEGKHFKAGEFIKLLTDKLKVGDTVAIAAVKIWENIERLGLMKSTHAMTLAACCLKFSCSLSGSDQSFDVLALAAETTKTTLKNMYRELFPHRFKFITKDCKLRDPKELKEL